MKISELRAAVDKVDSMMKDIMVHNETFNFGGICLPGTCIDKYEIDSISTCSDGRIAVQLRIHNKESVFADKWKSCFIFLDKEELSNAQSTTTDIQEKEK